MPSSNPIYPPAGILSISLSACVTPSGTGFCSVACYLIEELKMDPQDRDKVCGVPGEGKMCSKVQGLHVCL